MDLFLVLDPSLAPALALAPDHQELEVHSAWDLRLVQHKFAAAAGQQLHHHDLQPTHLVDLELELGMYQTACFLLDPWNQIHHGQVELLEQLGVGDAVADIALRLENADVGDRHLSIQLQHCYLDLVNHNPDLDALLEYLQSSGSCAPALEVLQV